MCHLIRLYTVCPLVFEFSISYSLDVTFVFENVVFCFFVVKELIMINISNYNSCYIYNNFTSQNMRFNFDVKLSCQ